VSNNRDATALVGWNYCGPRFFFHRPVGEASSLSSRAHLTNKSRPVCFVMQGQDVKDPEKHILGWSYPYNQVQPAKHPLAYYQLFKVKSHRLAPSSCLLRCTWAVSARERLRYRFPLLMYLEYLPLWCCWWILSSYGGAWNDRDRRETAPRWTSKTLIDPLSYSTHETKWFPSWVIIFAIGCDWIPNAMVFTRWSLSTTSMFELFKRPSPGTLLRSVLSQTFHRARAYSSCT